MSISLNHSSSHTCIFSPQKPGPKESQWVQLSPQVLPEAGKWTGCTSEPGSLESLCSLDGGTQSASNFCCFSPSWQITKLMGFVHGLVSILWLDFFFSFSFVLKGCDRTAERKAASAFPGWVSLHQVDGGRERRRLQCLHADWKTPNKAHGLLVAKEQIYSQTSEVKERIHS